MNSLEDFFNTIMDNRIVASSVVFSHHHCSFSFLDEKFKNFILQEPLEYCLTLRTFGEILKEYTAGRGIISIDQMFKRVFRAGVQNRDTKNLNEYFHPIQKRSTATFGKYPSLPLLFHIEGVRRDCSDLFSYQFMHESTTPLCSKLNFYEYLRVYRTIPEIADNVIKDGTSRVMSIAEVTDKYAEVLDRRGFYKINKVENLVVDSKKFQEIIKSNYSLEEYYFTLI